MGFKSILKRIFPMPASSLQYELLQLSKISRINQEALQQLLQYQASLQQQINELRQYNQQAVSSCFENEIKQSRSLEAQNKFLEALYHSSNVLTQRTETLSEIQDYIYEAVRRTERMASEEVWAHIFNNTTSESNWLLNKNFSPGRWGVGYPYLYAMYRVLNETHPKQILELGLGQTTRMIAQYAAANHDVRHTIVEHDPKWIEFFSHDFALPSNSQIVRLDRDFTSYKEAKSIRIFRGFKEAIGNQSYDFISVDAPLGADMEQYARIDVLNLIPLCLAKEFVIMIDDTERNGERNMIKELQQYLNNAGLEYQIGVYSGQKECTLLCSKQLRFLKSM